MRTPLILYTQNCTINLIAIFQKVYYGGYMSYAQTPNAALLTASEEVELAKAIEAGSEAQDRIGQGEQRHGDDELVAEGLRARERFIEANVRLVLSVASKMKAPTHVDRQDVVQDGMLGLDRAVSKFDWRRGYKFSTYATWWIRQSIQVGLERSSSPVHIPARTMHELRNAHANDEEPGSERARAAAQIMHIDSLDRAVGDDDAATVADFLACSAVSPDDEVEELEDRRVVRQLIERLDPMSAHVVVARYGLDGREPETFAAIAERCGISPEAVRRRLHRTLDTLRPAAVRLTAPTDAAALAAFAA